MGGEDVGGGVAGDGVVGSFFGGGEALGVAELDGDDVLEELRDRLDAVDVALEGEDFGVLVDELVPVLGGLVVPGDEFFGGEGGSHCGFILERWGFGRRVRG